MHTHTQPVIGGFHPDPSICRVGDDYYLATSSFEYFPGIPIHHSTDLHHWTLIGNVLTRPGQVELPDRLPPSAGVFAPTLRHHNGLFHLITTVLGGGGTFLFTSPDAAGPWSDPVPVPGVTGIDPDLAWDDDGTCYCTWAGIHQIRIDPLTGDSQDLPRTLYSGTGGSFPEGPHLHRRGAWWYLVLAEGGTGPGHAVSVARSTSPQGPFEPHPHNPVLTHRGTNNPVQNTGHADLVEAPDASWWMVHLGVRPRGAFPSWHTLGRETFLAPVTWTDDGWPVIGAPTGPTSAAAPLWYDDFATPALRPQWAAPGLTAHRNADVTERPGRLTLHARPAAEPPVFIGRRQQHPSCTVRAAVDASGGSGGLALRMDDRHLYALVIEDGQVHVDARIGPLAQRLRSVPCPTDSAVLEIQVTATPVIDLETDDSGHGIASIPVEVIERITSRGPDRVQLIAETQEHRTLLAELDGRYLSTEVTGGFTGRLAGLLATRGTVRTEWFSYEPAP